MLSISVHETIREPIQTRTNNVEVEQLYDEVVSPTDVCDQYFNASMLFIAFIWWNNISLWNDKLNIDPSLQKEGCIFTQESIVHCWCPEPRTFSRRAADAPNFVNESASCFFPWIQLTVISPNSTISCSRAVSTRRRRSLITLLLSKCSLRLLLSVQHWICGFFEVPKIFCIMAGM